MRPIGVEMAGGQRRLPVMVTLMIILLSMALTPVSSQTAQARTGDGVVHPGASSAQAQGFSDEEIEHAWKPDYVDLATGDPSLTDHGVYAWPFALDSIGWSMQSYQDYGGTPYFHHGMDMMKIYGTDVFNRSGGQVINIENYQPGWDLYWEVAVLDPDGYIWQYHHIDQPTIPQYIWNKWYEYQADPVNGGFIPPNTYLGDIIYWPVWSFGKQFNHIHLNILAAGGVYVNGFEFHNPLPDTVGPQIQGAGLLKNGQVYAGNTVEGDYSLYVHARDLILDDVYYLPPWEINFSVDGGPLHTTWRFDTLPGGADDTAYLNDFYVVPPTCGDYECRDYYIDLGFIPDAQYVFPASGGEHTLLVSVRDYAGNFASQEYTYTVIGPPAGTPVWHDDFETNRGWVRNPVGNDTATSGLWERGDPEQTFYSGPKQLGSTPSGLNDLVTGRLAGSSADAYDVDEGVTSIRSPNIALPADTSLVLSFRYYLAHSSNSSSADYLRVKVVGSTMQTVFEELGSASDDDGVWEIKDVSLNEFAGETVYLLIQAVDSSPESTIVEAGIDEVWVIATDTNHAPIADPQSVSTPEDTELDLLLTGSDPDGDPITYTVASNPSHGILSGIAPTLVYIPASNYNGTDSFTFIVTDGKVNSQPATVDIEIAPVNDAPLAVAQTLSTPEDTSLSILLTGVDPDGDPLTYALVSNSTHGTLSGDVPNLTYLPANNYTGSDSFTFSVSDGVYISSIATISITITPINDAPVASAQAVTTRQSTPVAIALGGWDVEGDALTYLVVSQPVHGVLSGAGPFLFYTPAAGYSGSDSFTFIVNDGELNSEPAAVSITIHYFVNIPIIFRVPNE